MARALGHVKVLDFTRVYGASFCTQMLAELGAEVIKVEIPEVGDQVRRIGMDTTGLPFMTKSGESGIFITLNRGKKSITLNLASEKGQQIARNLAKWADVLVENFTPGVMSKLGLGYDELSKLNPKLIYASVSGFGHTGPRASEPAFDMIVQAMGGLISVMGFPGGPPIKVGLAIADYLSGLYTAIAILAALQSREKTGVGQVIDISMQDCVWALTAIDYGFNYFLTGKNPERLGNDTLPGAPLNIYRTKDDYVIISAGTLRQWENLLRCMGREDMIGITEYSTSAGRVRHRDETNALVEGWTRQKTVKEILDTLRRCGVPCAPIPTFDQVANDPQLLSREMIVEVEQTISGKVKVPGSVFKLCRTPGDARLPAPFLGEHNHEVYCKKLNYSEEELRKLQEDGII